MSATDSKSSLDNDLSLELPAGFLWGASTSSYQIEGAVNEEGRGASIWDTHCRQKNRVLNGDTGDVACDHYHRYREDIALMQTLGIQAYRFSAAWPRVMARGRGAANEKGLDFYDRLIDGCLEKGIEPWLCLYHWDLPQSLGDLGGWTNRDIAGWFADYAALIARRYGDRVKHFATFNEPSVSTIFGYLLGWNPPAAAERESYLKAVHHLNMAHGSAVQVIRGLVSDALIGSVHNIQQVLPCADNEEDKRAAAILDAHWNAVFPEPQHLGVYPELVAQDFEPYQKSGDMALICQKQDWFGVNHYSPIYAKKAEKSELGFAWGDPPANIEKTAIGWPVSPESFGDVLQLAASRYQLPVYVTENGCGGNDSPNEKGEVDDLQRVKFLNRYIRAMAQAIKNGADVRGYFVWSLLDNFEWNAGYANRFGIVHVDFETQKRTIKSSGNWYRDLIQKNSGNS